MTTPDDASGQDLEALRELLLSDDLGQTDTQTEAQTDRMPHLQDALEGLGTYLDDAPHDSLRALIVDLAEHASNDPAMREDTDLDDDAGYDHGSGLSY